MAFPIDDGRYEQVLQRWREGSGRYPVDVAYIKHLNKLIDERRIFKTIDILRTNPWK
jgi:hypothetical protein